MRGTYRTIVIELPKPHQVWSASEVWIPLINALEKLTGVRFKGHVTSGALLLVPTESEEQWPGVATKLIAIVEGRYAIPEHQVPPEVSTS